MSAWPPLGGRVSRRGNPRTPGRDRRHLDVRLVLPAVATWCAAWLGTSGLLTLPTILLAWSVLAVTGLLAHQVARLRAARVRWGPLLAGVGVLLLAAAVAGTLRMQAVTQTQESLAPYADSGREVSVVLVATSDPVLTKPSSSGEPKVRWFARLEQVSTSVTPLDVAPAGQAITVRVPVMVIAGIDWTDVRVGDRIDGVPARLQEWEGSGSSLVALALVTAERQDTEIRSGAPFRWAEPFRRGLREAADGLSSDPRGLVPALVVGDESTLPTDLRVAMQRSGLAHLTAVSGANVAVVVGAVLLLGRRAGLSARGLVALSLVAIVVFVVVARPQASVVRAAAMGSIAAAALVTGRRGRGTANLAAAVVGLLLLDPWLSRSIGFALSVAATGGILAGGRALADPLGRWLPTPVALGVAVSLAAQLAVLPLLVLINGEVSVVGVVANLLVSVLVAPATVLGFAAAVVAPAWHAGGTVLAWLAGVPTAGIAAVARLSSTQPGAVLDWHGGWFLAALSALVGLVVLRRLLGSPVGGVTVLVVLVLLVRRPVPGASWPPADWALAACDVGQGDALVLRSGPTAGVVVDAGPDPDLIDACLRRLDVREVPMVVITHLHADHVDGVSGISGANTHREIGAVLTTSLREPRRGDELLRAWSRRMGVVPGIASMGEHVQVSPRLGLHMLGPLPRVSGGSAANQASVVMLATVNGVRVLLTGDLEAEAQRALLLRAPDLRAAVLKVAHHGSADQFDPLTAAVQPQVALISVGEDNTYGHPAPGTLLDLQHVGARVYRTDMHGDLAVAVDHADDGAASTGLRVVWRG